VVRLVRRWTSTNSTLTGRGRPQGRPGRCGRRCRVRAQMM
jgi:hypothetical protein